MSLLVHAYIGLGSNLANPKQQIKTARLTLSALDTIDELAFSSLYSSPPMGPQDQPDYINAVMAIATTLTPHELLRQLQQIEQAQGRVRDGERWGARTLDLDLLLYGAEEIAEAHLIVPHSGLSKRAFVLYPLYEIAPDLSIPGQGLLAHLVRDCPINGLRRL